MKQVPTTFRIVSNGHGEDVIGAALGRALGRAAPGAEVVALPLVGAGSAYESAGIPLRGPRVTLPSGGFMLHSAGYFFADLRAGYLQLTAHQVATLSRTRADVIIVVGDVYAQGLAALARGPFRAVLQPLVSVHHATSEGARTPLNRYFMERIRYPERALMRHLSDVVYLRDAPTAEWLRRRGLTQATWLGNPIVDRAVGTPIRGVPELPVVALLPGTRSHTPRALQTMAAALALSPGTLGLVAWSGGALPALPGWTPEAAEASVPPGTAGPAEPAVRGRLAALRHGSSRLWVVEGRFADVLASSMVAVGTAGTANEQAAATGLPIVSFPVEPHYTRAYLANQRRLLAAALTVVEPDPVAIAAAVRSLLTDERARAAAGAAGRDRLGGPGGSQAIADDILRRWALKREARATP